MELGTGERLSDSRGEVALQAKSSRRQKGKLSSFLRVELSDRDKEILKFVLEMKFSSATEIFERFFARTNSGAAATSSQWARKRLRQLESAGFLNSQRYFAESDRFYLATYRAYYTLASPTLDLPRPLLSIDSRTFIHDSNVLRLRSKIENSENVLEWISDRRLRSGKFREFGFQLQNVPDGVYKTSELDTVAIELEIATKSRERYRERIKSYLSLLRGSRSVDTKLSRVRFICMRSAPFEILKSETKLFGPLFSIEQMEVLK